MPATIQVPQWLKVAHWKVENFGHAEDKKEIQRFSIDFRMSEIKIEIKKFILSESNGETIF